MSWFLSKVAERLCTRYVGRSLHAFASVPSTQDVARELAAAAAPEGTVVVAEMQTAGRGRLGRTWVSPPGGLYLSVILRPLVSPPEVPKLSLVGGVAAARAIERACRLPVGLRWPNDLLVNRRKVGGVLAEAGPDAWWVILGIGLNANAVPDLPEGATSLAAELGAPVDLEELFCAVCAELEVVYEAFRGDDFATVLRWWRERSTTLGRRVRVHLPSGTYEGIAEDVDGDGALLLRLPDGSAKRIVAGELAPEGV
ncbi:MAG: biotin--[acetyl-CoA-carboxylase] ligase [Armatimonadota bacterium]|nr:biotin--[acetyl-CoA-carboxylase] ligase [Armatimonadota bacterium]MDR7563769.1 biotin--[acetyl-CoA-carboxylase] ligase [Armatimonadota bacterium]MDR7601811.1 biotin--[acetyl-CoA-carboxylase] ligase [Armatimonadota bacterium]